MSWWVCLLLPALILTTCWFKKRKIRWLVFQSWRQSTDQGLVLLWASVRSSPVPAFLLFILASSFPSASDLSPAVLHWSLLTQNTSLGQGQTTSLLSYSWYWDLPLFSIAHTEKCAILLSRKVAKRNKKTNVLKGIEMQPLWLLYFPLLFSHHHQLQPQQEQWDKSCPISQSVQFSSVQSLSGVWLFATPWTAACQHSLSITNSQSLPKISHKVDIKSLNEKLQSRKEDYFSWSSRLGLTALHSQRNRDAWWNQLPEWTAVTH